MQKRSKSFKTLQGIITLLAVLLLAGHLLWPQFTIDAVTLVLIVVAAIPWLIPLFKSLEFPGGWKVEFQEENNVGTEAKARAAEAIRQSASSNQTALMWDKVATLFWLANDLMWVL